MDHDTEALAAFASALAGGASRSAAFEEALAVWRTQHPEQSELRASADLATAIWVSGLGTQVSADRAGRAL